MCACVCVKVEKPKKKERAEGSGAGVWLYLSESKKLKTVLAVRLLQPCATKDRDRDLRVPSSDIAVRKGCEVGAPRF